MKQKPARNLIRHLLKAVVASSLALVIVAGVAIFRAADIETNKSSHAVAAQNATTAEYTFEASATGVLGEQGRIGGYLVLSGNGVYEKGTSFKAKLDKDKTYTIEAFLDDPDQDIKFNIWSDGIQSSSRAFVVDKYDERWTFKGYFCYIDDNDHYSE